MFVRLPHTRSVQKKVQRSGDKSATERSATSVVTTVETFHWVFSSEYEVLLQRRPVKKGDEEDDEEDEVAGTDEVVVVSRAETHTESALMTGTAANPLQPCIYLEKKNEVKGRSLKKHVRSAPLLLTWFLRQLRCSSTTSAGEDPILAPQFCIQRLSEKCKTPRRNEDSAAALEWTDELAMWTFMAAQELRMLRGCNEMTVSMVERVRKLGELSNYSSGDGCSSQHGNTGDAFALQEEAFRVAWEEAENDLVVPVVPLFAEQEEGTEEAAPQLEDAGNASGPQVGPADIVPHASRQQEKSLKARTQRRKPVLAAGVDKTAPLHERAATICNILLRQELSTLQEFHTRCMKLRIEQPSVSEEGEREASSSEEAATDTGDVVLAEDSETHLTIFHTVLLEHMRRVAKAWEGTFEYVEALLYSKLAQAVGKQLTERDFDKYMEYHLKCELFREQFVPRPFCHAVRRSSEHSPEGVLSLELNGKPVFTVCSSIQKAENMKFALNAATDCTFAGSRHLHLWLVHAFDAETHARCSLPHAVRLNATARQFSSFIVLLGRITGPTNFDPTFSFLCRNKVQFSSRGRLKTCYLYI